MVWTPRSSRTVYENRWIHVREDEVTGPDGDGIYGVVRMQQPSVFVIAIDDRARLCMVELERYTTGRSLELPSGGSDGEDPLVAAQRELREESGVTAARWDHIGRMHALNGIAEAPEHVFLAQDLHIADATASQREEGIEAVRWIPFADVLGLVADGTITDGETIGALAFAGIRLGRFR